MLALIRTLAPLTALLLGSGGGLALGAAAFWAFNDLIDNPHVRELVRVEERSACTIRTLEAAQAAAEAERTRQERAGAAALEQFRQAAELREQARLATEDKLEQEITQNEAALAARGRSCIADDADVRWMRGERGALDPTAGGG